MTREEELRRVQAWIEEGVLLFGGSRISAVTVGEMFADGIHAEWQRQEAESD